MQLKKDQLEAQSSKTPQLPTLPQDPPEPPQADTPPPPPLPSPVREHSTPKAQNMHPHGSMASLMAQFQQSHLRDVSPKNTPSKTMPIKDTPKKGEPMPSKKILTPDKTAEPPVKKQCTDSPSSKQESETDNNRAGKHKEKKKKKKKEVKRDPTMATNSEVEETEEQQEKHQWARKWKRELHELQEYHESCNIFLNTLPERNRGSHMGYLESCIHDAGSGFFFIRLIEAWRMELQKQSQGIGHSATTAHHRLQMLKRMSDVKLSNQHGMHAEYLVEVFKYPGTRDRIPTDTADGYGMMPMIGLYGLMELYSIARITTMQSGVVGEDGKKKSMSKCHCSLCDYMVQNHPSINNHVCTHLHLSLLCTINGCFTIKHG